MARTTTVSLPTQVRDELIELAEASGASRTAVVHAALVELARLAPRVRVERVRAVSAGSRER